MLHAKEVPSKKGGTMFADMRAAYEALPEARKQLLPGLTGLHGRSTGPAGERLYGDEKGVTEKKYQEVREEAWALIEELAEHATQERFVYYHRWRAASCCTRSCI